MDNMTPIDWAKRPLTKYADFGGRAPRAEYWWFFLAFLVASVIAYIIDSILDVKIAGIYGLVSLALTLALLVPGLAVAVRRLHDTGRSGWWILIALVPYVLMLATAGGAIASGSAGALAGAGLVSILAFLGAIVLLIFMVLPGTRGDNRFGPDPYGGQALPVA